MGNLPYVQIKEVWRCQASENVDCHNVLVGVENCVISSVAAGVNNKEPLPNFDEFARL